MMLQTNLGNAMTIINNTAHSLAQNEALVAWAETRRLALNAMKPNKQPHTFSRLAHSKAKPNKPFQKHQISSILFMMVMCWASQSSAQPTRAKSLDVNRTVGQCIVSPTPSPTDLKYPDYFSIFPKGVAWTNYPSKAHDQVLATGYDDAVVTILQKPKHGILSGDFTDGKGRDGFYYPNPGYKGNDKAVFLVNKDGYKVKVILYFKVPNLSIDDLYQDAQGYFEKYCNNVNIWKISGQTPDGTLIFSNEDTAVSSAGAYTPTPSPLLGNYSNSAYPNLTYSFTDLPGTALGETKSVQTTGSGTAANILLDINAAGRG